MDLWVEPYDVRFLGEARRILAAGETLGEILRSVIGTQRISLGSFSLLHTISSRGVSPLVR